MLGALEALVGEALRREGLAAALGPAPPEDRAPGLRVHARALRRAAGNAQRERGAYAARRDALPDGTAADLIPLPAGALPLAEEVQRPPGRLARRGESWQPEPGGLRLLAGAGPAELLSRGTDRLEGFRERAPAEAALDLLATAATAAEADALLARGLAAALAALAAADVVVLAWEGATPTLRLRLLDLAAGLEELRREGVAGGVRATAALRLVGTLETALALGAPPPGVTPITAVEPRLAP